MGYTYMFTLLCSSWSKIKKKFNKLLPVFMGVFIFFGSSLSGHAQEIYDVPFNAYYLSNEYVSFYGYINSVWTLIDSKPDVHDTNMEFDTGSYDGTNVSALRFSRVNDGWTIPVNPNKDYYLTVFLFTDRNTSSLPTSMYAQYYDYDFGGNNNFPASDFGFGLNSMPNKSGSYCYTKIDLSVSANLRHIAVRFSAGYDLPNLLDASIFMFEVDKDTSDEQVSSIIQAIQSQTSTLQGAINNQTSIIGGKIDKSNNLIDNGDSNTPGIISQFNSNLTEFNETVEQFNDIENGFIRDFSNANDIVKDSLTDVSFTGNLLSCANWVTDTYMNFFNASGDFKQYFIYPLIIGIVLFFIGRGGVILGNLYRKPYDSSKYTVSSGYTVKYDDGTKRSETYTRTTGKGGKWRK